ncbi:hypothetical protein AA105894_2692 [Asaia spathodeae NBRC 105894]|nr:hypothetical protein AA105894_2692 [Asaia spathodeae NBRC 105894]
MPSGMFASAAHAQTIRRYTSSVGWDFPAFHRVNVEQATFASRQIVGMLLPASLAISSNSEGV